MSNRSCYRLLGAAAVVLLASVVQADDVVLNSKMTLSGRVRPVKQLSSDSKNFGDGKRGNYRLIDRYFKHYFVPTRNIDGVKPGDAFQSETFKLKHKTVGRASVPLYIGSFSSITPFDETGVRRVTLETSERKTQTILQAIDRLKPEYASIRSTSHKWAYGVATNSIPESTLDKLLNNAVDQDDVFDRLAGAKFLIAAEKFNLASIWLERIRNDFPGRKEQCRVAELSLREEFARVLIGELKRRREAGQHKLVVEKLGQFPRDDLPAAVVNEVEAMEKEYAARQVAIEKVLDQLARLEAAIDPKLTEQCTALRSELQNNLDATSMERVMAYIQMSSDKTFKPEERLSIAYSGWLLGSANAITTLPETLGIAEAKDLVRTFYTTDDPLEKHRAIDKLKRLEGVSPQRLQQLLSASPPLDAGAAQPLVPTSFTLDTERGAAEYKVVLPPEYSPYKTYPMIVTLRQANLKQEAALAWWCGTPQAPMQAPRHGYIVIAPQYMPAGTRSYVANPQSHNAVLASVRDAMSRFNVDPDRVFLTGHGSGGDATFDIAMAHPDVFAGAIPICGFTNRACNRLATTNGAGLPWYFVTGQRHRAALDFCAGVLDNIRKGKGDLIVCEYRNRGFESYYEEIHELFQWMDTQKREPIPREFEVSCLRPEDNAFYWIEGSGFPEWLGKQDFKPPTPGTRRNSATLKSVSFEIRALKNNAFRIRRKGSKNLTLRFIDGVIDFTKPVKIDDERVNPDPSIDDVLEDYRIYSDRSRIALQRYKR